MNEDLVVLELAGQQYALPVRQVREVLPRAALMALPGAPSGVLGVLSLRGVLLPVVDLRQRLGLPSVPASVGQHVVVVDLLTATVGLLVDAVTGIAAGPADSAGESREPSPTQSHDVIRRVAEIDGRVMSVLEPRAAVGAELVAYVAAIAPPSASDTARALPGQTVSGAR
jgi:purine-binding chemotaxis protein CheW